MSGGAWGYLSYRFEDVYQTTTQQFAETMRLLGAIEHELDWGISGDTCYDCASNRVVPALVTFFDLGATDADEAITIVRDQAQHRCARHRQQEQHSER